MNDAGPSAIRLRGRSSRVQKRFAAVTELPHDERTVARVMRTADGELPPSTDDEREIRSTRLLVTVTVFAAAIVLLLERLASHPLTP